MATEDRVSMLTFYMGRYDINGTFLGFEILRDQLNLCPFTYDDVLNMMRFGAVTESSCEFELSQLIEVNSKNMPRETNYFFDLYIKDRNGNLIDVPIAIRNYRQNNKIVNTGSISNSWQLVRRFFIFDTISGYSEANKFITRQ